MPTFFSSWPPERLRLAVGATIGVVLVVCGVVALAWRATADNDEAEREEGEKKTAARAAGSGSGSGASAGGRAGSSGAAAAAARPAARVSSGAGPSAAAAPAPAPAAVAGAVAVLAPSGGSSEGGGGGGGGGGGFSKATLKKILQAMISKFEAHKKAQTERQEQLELQGMSPEAIVQSLQGELMQRLQTIEAEIQQQFGADQEALMAAQERYKEDPEIAGLMRDIKLLFFGPEQVAEQEATERRAEGNLPAGMTVEKFLPIFERHVATVHDFATEKMHEVRRDTPAATFEERAQYHGWLLNQHIETVHASFLNAVGLSADEFQACLVKFGNGKHLVERIIASEQRLNETRQKILGQ